MIIIIPIGGIGKRFKDNGYTLPKALIKVFGKPILFYLIESLNLEHIDFIYIPYNLEYQKYRLEDLLIKNFPNIKFRFFCLKNNTRGAAETLKISLENLYSIPDQPIISIDTDNFFTCDIVKLWNGENIAKCPFELIF